jgi:PAS domain S-box-containing protein
MYRRRKAHFSLSPLGSAALPSGPSALDVISSQRRAVPTDHHALLDSIPAMLFTARRDGMWDYVSLPFCAYTGSPTDTLTGLGWAATLHDEDQADALHDWQAALRGGIPCQMEYCLRGADGDYRWFRMKCAPQHDAAGEILAWAGIATPLEGERQLAVERTMRQQAEQERDTSHSVVAIVAHELRAPLTVLLGQAKMLQRRLDASPAAEPRDQRVAAMLVEQTLRLSRLLGALMDTAEIDRGQLQISAITLDLGALVLRMVEALRLAVTTHTIRLQLEQGPFWVKGDALRLEQVLQNLIQNALKYSSAGSTVTITVTPEQQGLGLGLYLSRVIMELHAGRIDVQSVEGRAAPQPCSSPAFRSHLRPPTGGRPCVRRSWG